MMALPVWRRSSPEADWRLSKTRMKRWLRPCPPMQLTVLMLTLCCLLPRLRQRLSNWSDPKQKTDCSRFLVEVEIWPPADKPIPVLNVAEFLKKYRKAGCCASAAASDIFIRRIVYCPPR